MSFDSNTLLEGTNPTATSAEEEAYILLIHSLTHDHTSENYERHCLLFEKWCRDYTEGVYICHLKYVVSLLEILRQRIERHPSMFLPVLSPVLRVLSKVFLYTSSAFFTYYICVLFVIR